MNSKGQFSIMAAMLVAVILVGTVITTYATLHYSTSQEQPQTLSTIDETNVALEKVLGFTVGYYGSVLQVTGDTSYAKDLTANYLSSSLNNIGNNTHPEWGSSFHLASLDLSANWFTNNSYSAGQAVVSYNLTGLGIYGMSYSASSRLDVQVSNSSNGKACLTVLKDGNEPLVNLGRQNFKFYRYQYSNLTWNFEAPSGELTTFSNGTYLIEIPTEIDPSTYVVQVTDTRGITVAAASFSRITSTFMWNTTTPQGADYVDSSTVNKGSQSNFTAQQYGPDGVYDTLTEGPVLPNYYPSSYVLGGLTANVSGTLSYLQFDDGVRMIFRSYASATSPQTLYTHQETTSIAGTSYNTLMINSANSTGLTLNTAMNSSRVLLGKSVYSLQGVSSIPASTWTMYYRTWRDKPTYTPTNNPSSTSGGWTNSTNAYADGAPGYAYSTMNGTKQVYGGYGFSVPGGASITQVRVRLDAYCSGGDNNDKILLEVSDGTSWFAATTPQSLTTSEVTYWIDVTGWTSWTTAEVNSIKTRVTQIRAGSLTDEVRLDWVPIEVTYLVSNVSSDNAGSNSAGWTNAANAYVDGGGYASSTTDGNQQVYGGYGFSLPSNATITQVRVRLDAYRSGGDGNEAILLGVSNGTWLSATQVQSLTGSEVTYWIDVTGWASWAPTNINSIQTRVSHVRYGSSTDEVRLDYIKVEVTYTSTTTTVTYSPISNSGTWTNPGNAYANGGGYAESDANGEQQRYWGYNFALPSNAVINQVRVRLDAYTYRPYGSDSRDDIGLQVSVDGGSSWLPASPSVQQLTSSETTSWIDVTDWASWTPTQVNNIQARVTHVREGSANEYVRLDWIPIEVTYSTATVSTDDAASNSAGWTNPANAHTDGSGYASSTTDGNQQVYSGYGFSLPSNATVTHVRVRLDANCVGGEGDDRILLGVSDATGWLATTQEQSLTTSEVTYWIDVTGWASWTPAKLSSVQARVSHARYSGLTDEVRLDYIQVEVTYGVPTTFTKSPSSNSVGWTNPNYAYSDDSNSASSTNDGDQQVYGGYGFSIPSDAQIAQVRVRLDAWCATDDDILLEVSSDGGSTWLATTQTQSVTTAQVTYWVNVTSWASWTPENINNGNVKARVTHVAVSLADEVRLDWVPIEVTYTIPITAHADVDLLIRKADNSIRTTIATNVASSGDLQPTATTLSGPYSWSTYTVVNQTDYLEVDYYVDVATITSSYAYLRIDDQSLALTNQTRIANVMLPSEYTSEVEFIGSADTESWAQLAWATDSSCTLAGVNVTVQSWNYAAGRYALSGERGYNSTIVGTSDVAMTQNITTNPADFRSSSTGEWKLKFKAVKSSYTQFDLNIDLARYSPVPNYMLDIEEQWSNVNYAYPRQDLCIRTGALGLEDLLVDVHVGSSWITVFDSLQPNAWNNVSVTPYISLQNFTIRFRDGNSSSDPTQTSWDMDAVLLCPQPDVDVLLSKLDHIMTIEFLQNGTMRWLGQNLQLTTQAKPIPPVPVKAIHVSQTINGASQEVPFQVEDWASEYRIALGLTSNATVFSNRQMIVFLINVNVSKVTVWWDGSDTATQTLNAYTNLYFTGDDTGNNRLTNGNLTLQFGSGFTVNSTVGSTTNITANFMRINNEASTYGSGLAYVIHHGIVRDVVQQEAEWGTDMGGGGAYSCPNVYANIVLTLPARATYYTYQLRLMFINSTGQPRNIADLCPIKLSTSLTLYAIQTENGTVNTSPIVASGNGTFNNYGSGGSWTAHHWSQFNSTTGTGAGIMFANASNQLLYAFDPPNATALTGSLNVSATTSTKTIEFSPVTQSLGQVSPFTTPYTYDISWHGAVVTFDGAGNATPIYKLQGTAPSGLWLLVEYPPTITVSSES